MDKKKNASIATTRARMSFNRTIAAAFDDPQSDEVDIAAAVAQGVRRAAQNGRPVFWQKGLEVNKDPFKWFPLIYAVYRASKSGSGRLTRASITALLRATSPDLFLDRNWLALFMTYTVRDPFIVTDVAENVPAAVLAGTDVADRSAPVPYLDLLIRQMSYDHRSVTTTTGPAGEIREAVIWAAPGTEYREAVAAAILSIVKKEPSSLAGPFRMNQLRLHTYRLARLVLSLTELHQREQSLPRLDMTDVFSEGDLEPFRLFNAKKTAAWLTLLCKAARAERDRAIDAVANEGADIEDIPLVKSIQGSPTLTMLAISFNSNALLTEVLRLVTAEDREAVGTGGIRLDAVIARAVAVRKKSTMMTKLIEHSRSVTAEYDIPAAE